jgi:hypothetical protein
MTFGASVAVPRYVSHLWANENTHFDLAFTLGSLIKQRNPSP